MTTLAPILEAFFTDRLMTQRAATPHTIASYRDTFKLLLGYLHAQTGKPPSQLDLTDLDAATIGGFLNHLEAVRNNSAATRNNRLAAIHSLFRYAALQAPEHLNLSRPNAPPRPSSATSPALNSTRCSPRRTAAPGTAVVTMPCSCSPPKPGSESPS